MKTVKRYCKSCRKETTHDHTRDLEGGGRLFMGIFTMGISELGNDHIFECQICDEVTVKIL